MAKKRETSYVEYLRWSIDRQVEVMVWKDRKAKAEEEKRLAENREKLIAGYRRHVERQGASE